MNAPTIHIRCKCGVPMNNRDKVLYCEFSDTCPRWHEHDEVKWQRVKQQADGGRT